MGVLGREPWRLLRVSEVAVGPEQHLLGRTEWQKSHVHDGVCGRRVGRWGKGLGNINNAGSPPDPGQLGDTLRFRCVGCLEVGQQGRGWGLEFAISVWEGVSSLTSLLWRRGPHPAPRAGGPGHQVLICTLQEAAWCVKVHSPEGILYSAGASDQSSALALPPSGGEG